jgi:hypothetical protein
MPIYIYTYAVCVTIKKNIYKRNLIDYTRKNKERERKKIGEWRKTVPVVNGAKENNYHI